MKFLVTGAAGFIGFYVCQRLLALGHQVVGIDNLNDYYAVQLKQDRLAQLLPESNFTFIELDIANRDGMAELFRQHQFQRVIHLAAQAGVRYSIENPLVYGDSNLTGMLHVLEGCRQQQVEHLVYASSSSVYGMNPVMPFSVQDRVDHPVSLYAATKKANELMAHSYSHLYRIPTTGLRFFTVYGPWGRPDMAMFLFADAIANDKPIKVFNQGKMQRDFTYIDDIVEGVVRVQDCIPQANPDWDPAIASESTAPYKIFNIGNNQPVELMTFIGHIEQAMGKEAIKEFLPMQAGDVPATYADIDDLSQAVGFQPATPVATGVQRFVAWYQDYYRNRS
ncbi:NAD-dependent epimerase [Alkalimonas delamerensis]|uniref:NAD-dependent epimerase n=1 Tax=Alkalimonas delamerensis TaxID=265981 RepID=A0ABT9GN90_9GAMM|nr:NAD-dependent epimerase [Alkalimonas delamerensis]MDP4528116.1 NAD-dependent epimerase [Alkalimonas delamerensis]